MKIIEILGLEDKISVDELERKLDVFRQYQQYFYIGIIVVVVIQLVFSYTLPSIQSYNKGSKLLARYEKILLSRQKKTSDKEVVQSEIDRLSNVLQEKKRSFFTKKGVEEFAISRLPKMSEYYDIKITSTSFNRTMETGKGVKDNKIKLNMEGTFANFMNFFYSLEQYEKSIKIQSVSFSRKSVNPVILKANVDLSLFSLGVK